MIKVIKAENDVNSIKCMLNCHVDKDLLHKCSSLINLNSVTDNCHIVSIQKRWYFIQERYADRIEVGMGEAKEIGQFMTGEALLIYYCPFCGEKLGS